MNKIIPGMAAILFAAMLTAVSCGRGDGGADSDTLVSRAVSDSACYNLGMMAGGQLRSELGQYEEYTGKEYDRKDFYEGLKAAVSEPRSEAYMAGLSAGMQVYETIRRMEELGIRIDRGIILDALRDQITGDSVPTQSRIGDYYMKFNATIQRLRKEKAAPVPEIRSEEADTTLTTSEIDQ